MNQSLPPPSALGALSETFYVFDDDACPQNSFCYMLFRGRADESAFAEAVTITQLRYPAMACRLEKQKVGLRHLLVRVPLKTPPALEVLRDLEADLGGRTAQQALSDLLRPRVHARIDLFTEPAARFFLVHLPDEHGAIVIFFHHIVTDGGNMMGLIRTLLAAYHEQVAGSLPDWAKTEDMPSSSSRKTVRPSILWALAGLIADAIRTARHPVVRLGDPTAITRPDRFTVRRDLTAEQTVALVRKAHQRKLTVNDLLSIEVVRTIDEQLGEPSGTLSFWVPVNLRSTSPDEAHRANLSSAINVDLTRSERSDPQRLARTFLDRRNRRLAHGVEQAQYLLLKKLVGAARFFRPERRKPWLKKLLVRPMTFIVSNVGVLWPKRVKGRLTPGSVLEQAGNLEILHYDMDLSPDPNVGHAMVVHTFRGQMSLNFSVFAQAMDPDRAQVFLDRLVERLCENLPS